MHPSLNELILPIKQDEQRVAVNQPLYRFALFTVFSTLCLLVAGALVTSNDAGLSVPDWPLSYGQWMPPMTGGVFYEHGHRMVASFVGLLTVILAAWVSRVEPRSWVRRLGWVAVGAVVVQGILGGITVLFLLPAPVSVGHACLAQLFFCIVSSLALVLSPSWKNGEQDRSKTLLDEGIFSLSRLTIAVSAAVFLQHILGAMLRHKALGVAPHLLTAAIVTFLTIWVVVRISSRYSNNWVILGWGLTLNALVAVQLLLGAAAYWVRHVTEFSPQPLLLMVVLTSAHLVVGALVLAASVLLTMQVHARLHRRMIRMHGRELPQVI